MLSSLELAERLRVAIGRLARRLRQQSLGGLTPSQTSILFTLDNRGEMTMGRLAECEAISRPSATGIVDRLAEKGLVTRSPNPDDKRSALVTITPEGRNLLQERRQIRTAYLADQIEDLSGDERKILLQAVEILESVYERS